MGQMKKEPLQKKAATMQEIKENKWKKRTLHNPKAARGAIASSRAQNKSHQGTLLFYKIYRFPKAFFFSKKKSAH